MGRKQKKATIDEGFFPGIPNSDYHGIKYREYIGHSGLVKLLVSPAHFKAYQSEDSKQTPAMEFGSAAHLVMLEDYGKKVAVCDITKRDGSPLDYWSEAGRKWKEDMIVGGYEAAVLLKDWDTLMDMRKQLFKHPIAKNLVSMGKAEQSGFFMNRRFEGVKCKVRVDFLIDDGSLLAFTDYKTASDASPDAFGKAAYDYGYDIQAAFYREAGEVLLGRKPHFFFIAQEKEPPYAVAVYCANDFEDQAKDSVFTEMGSKRVNRAMETYWKCIENPELFNNAYPERTLPIIPPVWALKEWGL